MDFDQLLYFRSVAHLGNISRAAEMHYTTHSCISKSISRLENELGTTLFTRRKGRLELNREGKLFLATVEESVSSLQKGINNLVACRTEKPAISLSCTMNYCLDPVLIDMSERYPELFIKVVEYGYSRLEKEFGRNDIDLAIVSRPYTLEGVVCQRLALADNYLIFHKDHSLARHTEVSLFQLKDDQFLCDIASVDKEMFISSCNAVGFSPNIRYEVKSISTALHLLNRNLCVAVLPPYTLLYCGTELSKDLRVVKLKENIPPLYIGIVYPESNSAKIAGPIYSDLIDLLSKQVQRDIRAGEALWTERHP